MEIIISVLVVIILILFPSIIGNVVSTYNDLTTKFVCKQQAYEDIEYYIMFG